MPLLLRNFMQLFVDKQTRTYDSDHSPARELWGMTIGIVGYGHIGREVARLAVAHGMRVVALKRNPQERRELGYNWKGIGDPEGLLPDTFYGPDQLHNLLRESDFVVDCLPYTPATKDLFGATEFEAMRATAYFINIGRGGTMDIPAVALAVRCDVIAGAALDDFQTGSHRLDTDSPLWDVDNIFISPHISGTRRNVQYLERTNELFCENLRRFLAGEPMYNVVTRERGY
jgi:phosphoglycerate dehydrogenase-like enzyme